MSNSAERVWLHTKKHELRKLFRRFGIDVVRYPMHDPMARTVKLLEHHRIDCVVDVGANDGGFATAIRGLGYNGRIISFEPLSGPFQLLKRKADADADWEAVQLALGETVGEVTINIAGNTGQSSSVLPMLKAHTDVAPHSRYVGTENVLQQRLDEILPQLGVSPHDRVFLKVDVQGYEQPVLKGASELFAAKNIVGLQLEISLVPLYDGAMTHREAMDHAEGLGMTLMGLDPVFVNPSSGQLLQIDAVYFSA